MYSQVYSCYSDICKIPAFSDLDSDASVAILDSVYEPSDEFSAENRIGETKDFVGRPDVRDTTGHGKGVTSILYGASKNIEYNFYRVVGENGGIPQRTLLRAMGTAHNIDNVDLINLSLGYDHSNDGVSCDMPNEPCKVREAAKQAIRDGITIVAAAGNADEDDDNPNDDGVCCPALLNEVVSVGGMYPVCAATEEADFSSDTVHTNTRSLPPLACWIHNGDPTDFGSPICTGLGCSPHDNCDENRIIGEWGGNVDHEPSEVDIMAPVAYPVRNLENEPDITSGTSFATPVVTGVVAEITAFLKENEKEIRPTQIQAALANTGERLEHGDGRYLQGDKAVKRIAERHGLRSSISRRPDDFEL